MIVIGKSQAALAMIFDALASNESYSRKVLIFNNMNIEGEVIFNETVIPETTVIGSDFEFVLGAVMPETKKILIGKYPIVNKTILNSTATISKNSKIGTGSMIDALVSISSGARLGKFVTVYSNSSIAHDCKIEDFVTICPNVAICGGVTIGEGSFIGAGSVIKNGVTIGENCVIGCGSVVIKDVRDGQTIYGNPAK